MAIMPTVIYSVIYVYMVVIVRKWKDFYNFTFGGHFEYVHVVILAMYAISFLTALLARKLHNRNIVK